MEEKMIAIKKIIAVGGVLLGTAGIVHAYLRTAPSKAAREFTDLAEDLLKGTEPAKGRFTEADIATLPGPVRRHLRRCGHLGKLKMAYMKVVFPDVAFSLGKGKKHIKIAYTQYNFVNGPDRIAYIDSSLYGVPFEGVDAYVDGKGSMKGIVAKNITLFDIDGEAMDKASLVTFLSECLFVPNAALQDYIRWEAIDAHHAKAVITAYGTTAEGIFTFNEDDEMIAFTTDDREATTMDGKSEKVRWSAICGVYKEINGIRQPTELKAVWHYDEGDFTYFDAKAAMMSYDK